MNANFRNTIFYRLVASADACPNDNIPEVVLSGKSNVGKSTLVNALADNRKLARTSQTPGKTQAIIYFNVDKKILIADLPGYGYARTSKEKKENFSRLTDQYFTSGRKIDLVLHLIDIRHEPSNEDKDMIRYMNEQNIPYFIIFTKCDKLSRQQMNNRLKELTEEFDFAEDSNVFAVSSEKKIGIEDLRKAINGFFTTMEANY